MGRAILFSQMKLMVEEAKSNLGERRLSEMTFGDMNVWLHERNVYPLAKRLYELASVLPYSSASCERNFSALKFVKTRLRSTMGEDLLDNLLFLFVEKELVNKVIVSDELMDKVLDKFASFGNAMERRVLL